MQDIADLTALIFEEHWLRSKQVINEALAELGLAPWFEDYEIDRLHDDALWEVRVRQDEKDGVYYDSMYCCR